MKWHLGSNGPSRCNATKQACPFGGPDLHFPTKDAAGWAYEAKMMHTTHTKAKKTSLTSNLIAGGGHIYPESALRLLGAYLESRPYKTLTVIPSGSHLYGTSIPGKENHDYDFIVFATPHPSLRTTKNFIRDEIDVVTVDVTKIHQLALRSSSFTEAFYGYQQGLSIYAHTDDPWMSYLNASRISDEVYYGLLSDCIRSHQFRFVEPVDPNNKVEFKNLKHTIRWSLYQARWGKGTGQFDPRLTPEERVKFLKALESGRLSTLFEEENL